MDLSMGSASSRNQPFSLHQAWAWIQSPTLSVFSPILWPPEQHKQSWSQFVFMGWISTAAFRKASNLLSMMLLRRLSRWLSRWEMVNAGKRRIAKRSCSHASMSSAKFIFLCTMENFTSGNWLATTCGKGQAIQGVMLPTAQSHLALPSPPSPNFFVFQKENTLPPVRCSYCHWKAFLCQKSWFNATMG